jgi:hypothetical protein
MAFIATHDFWREGGGWGYRLLKVTCNDNDDDNLIEEVEMGGCLERQEWWEMHKKLACEPVQIRDHFGDVGKPRWGGEERYRNWT